jgi:maltose O-acetyltransferase
MGPDVVIMTTAHAFEDPSSLVRLQGDVPIRSVTIGNDVWIGTRSIILPGVTLGDGCIIGAGSVVTRSVPPFAVAAGNPARVIRQRGDRLKTETIALETDE